jgi:hypothetical protein
MKKFANEQTGVSDGKKLLKYSDLAALCLKNVSVNRLMTVDVMKKSLEVLEVLEKSGPVIELENDHHKFLLEMVKAKGWDVFHKDLVLFSEAVEKAE